MKRGQRRQSSRLSKWYRWYVIYETVLINALGFVTLFFQCQLQDAEAGFLRRFPEVSSTVADNLFGRYWLKGDLNCAEPAERCLTYMVCGWLMIAGVLQVFINFDGVREQFFRNDFDTPRSIKIVCMLIFFACDWYWVVLMIIYRDVIGWQQIVGSAFDIVIRLYFVTDPSRCFEEDIEDEKSISEQLL